MRTLLWAVVVLALEVLLLCGYFGVLEMGYPVSTNVALALLVGTVSVVVWLGFKNGFQWTLHRLVLEVDGGADDRLDRPPQAHELRDYERLPESAEAFIYVAMSRLMLRRLAR
jgi:hypothetical protein